MAYYYPYYLTTRPVVYYSSIYSYWGWFPVWIEPTRIVVVNDDYIYSPDPEEKLDYEGVAQAKIDLRDALTSSKMDLFDRHLSTSEQVRICFDGQYSYSASAEDFYAMTSDMISSIGTTSLIFDQAVWMSPREIYTSATQIFKDPDGEEQTLFLSYRLRKLDGEWQVVEFGSSKNPVPCPYTDFRER
jgi:hypothetical protein